MRASRISGSKTVVFVIFGTYVYTLLVCKKKDKFMVMFDAVHVEEILLSAGIKR